MKMFLGHPKQVKELWKILSKYRLRISDSDVIRASEELLSKQETRICPGKHFPISADLSAVVDTGYKKQGDNYTALIGFKSKECFNVKIRRISDQVKGSVDAENEGKKLLNKSVAKYKYIDCKVLVEGKIRWLPKDKKRELVDSLHKWYKRFTKS